MVTDGICSVEWTGRRAVVSLPGCVDAPAAGPIGEQLLSVIDRGAAELIVDMSATASCDHAGAEAVVRAYRRAASNGTQLRLVVSAPLVRRVLSINGLDRLISMYPCLEAATTVPPSPGLPPEPAGTSRPAAPRDGHSQRDPAPPGSAAFPQIQQRDGLPGIARAVTTLADRDLDLSDQVINSLFWLGLNVQRAAGMPGDQVSQPLEEVLQRLDETIREIRDRAFATRPGPSSPAWPRNGTH